MTNERMMMIMRSATTYLALALVVLVVAPLLAVTMTTAASPSGAAKNSTTRTQPNVILILTDDQDTVLGGWKPMSKAQRLLTEQGATGTNWIVHTPVCCPSRAELLTSRYFHNVKVPHRSDPNCMYVNSNPEGPIKDWLFSPHLQAAGYTLGLFGKYLNNDVPLDAPPGFSEWLANNGGDYLNPTFKYNGESVQFNNGTFADYSTTVIGNISLKWIEHSLSQEPDKPLLAYIAPKAPHIQDGPGFPMPIAAPWYNETFPTAIAPRTPTWNRSCPDHHWIVAQQDPLTPLQANMSDKCYRLRWQTLLSVDDIVEDLIATLKRLGQLDNTYIIYTSDHGYRFGQFRMPQGKFHVYENDIRVPFVIRGPGITPNSTFDLLGTNVDVMASVLGLAGKERAPTMDGRSFIPHVVNTSDPRVLPATKQHIDRHQGEAWRSAALIEYYGLYNVWRYQHLEDTFNNTYRAIRTTGQQGEYVLAEFTDVRTNFNFSQNGTFFELFDLSTDPHQVHNIFDTAPSSLIDPLLKQLRQLYACAGDTCN